jgi:hypothetical protein
MNNRTLLSIVVVALIAFGILLFINQASKSRFIWDSTLNYGQLKEPYDLDLCLDLLKTTVEKNDFVPLAKPFNRYSHNGNKNLYLYIGNSYSASQSLTKSVKDFVANGNTAFISSTNFSKNFLESYFLSDFQSTCLPAANREVIGFEKELDSLSLVMGKTTYELNFDPRTSFLPFKYFNPGLTQCIQYQYGVEDVSYLNDLEKAVCIRISIGKGALYLHTVPSIFGNDQMKKEEPFEYFKDILGPLDYQKIYFDQLRFTESFTPEMVNSEGSLDHLWMNKSMRFMMLVILGLILLLLIFNAKRKFIPIPVIKPLENTSISFSKTISRLYWLKPNHKNMSELKMSMFLFEVRSRYGLSTEVINEVFAERLARKSGIAERKVQKLVETYRVIHQNERVHEDLLIQLNELIQYMRNHWK